MFEYKVIPAPTNGTKAKGVKTVEGRFANTLEVLMNKMASEGWEFQRAETLPSEERSGLMSKSTTYRNVLVFRRSLVVETAATQSAVVLPIAEIDPLEETHPETPAEMEEIAETIIDPAVEDYETAATDIHDEVTTPQPLVASRD